MVGQKIGFISDVLTKKKEECDILDPNNCEYIPLNNKKENMSQ